MPSDSTTKDNEHAVLVSVAPRISEALPLFLEHLRVEETRALTTLSRYRDHIRRLIYIVGDCAVTEIDGEKISLLKRRMLDSGCAPATIAGTMSAIRTFLRYLRDARGIPVYDPARVKRPKIPKREVEYLVPEELARFLAAIPTGTMSGLRDRALAEVLFSTGMRISEALSLNRKDIGWGMREAQIIGKGNKQRKVYFSERALQWLRSYLNYRYDSDEALFVTTADSPHRLEAQGTWRRFHRYGRLAGLGKTVYPHMFRHTLATTLLANGCPIGHIRVLLGHEQLTTTCRYYLGLITDKEAKRAHAEYLDIAPSDRTKDASPAIEHSI